MKRIVSLIALAASLAGTASVALADQQSRPEQAARPVVTPPNAAQLETLAVELADGTMRAFIDGVRQKDLRSLGPVVSLRFRKTYTPEQVNEAFKQFFSVTVTGDPLAGKSPIFLTAPLINTAGGLEVQGFYEVGTGILMFQLVYIREGIGWKLDGINVRSEPIKAPAPSAAPAEKPLKFKIPAGRMVEA